MVRAVSTPKEKISFERKLIMWNNWDKVANNYGDVRGSGFSERLFTYFVTTRSALSRARVCIITQTDFHCRGWRVPLLAYVGTVLKCAQNYFLISEMP